MLKKKVKSARDILNKVMLWKIYFGIVSLLGIANAFALVSDFASVSVIILVEFALFLIGLIGLFSFTFKKDFLPTTFWRIFFWVYLTTEIIYAIIIFFPDSLISEQLSFLLTYELVELEWILIGYLAEIPLFVALYHLTKNEHLVAYNPEMLPSGKGPRWGMFQSALWGYSIILISVIFVVSFLPMDTTDADSESSITSLALFIPLLLFWVLVIARHKFYKWNWWKTTLAANSLLYSVLIIFSSLLPPTEEALPETSSIDLIAIIQIGILLFGLYIFGRDQHEKIAASKHQMLEKTDMESKK